MNRVFIVAAALSGFTAVVFGAFGAHALKNLIEPSQIIIWDKGVQYQFYHALALYLTYLFLQKHDSVYVRSAGWCFIAGMLCFSGSLYLLATRALTGIPAVLLGPVTPLGGFFFIAAWLLIFFEARKIKEL